MLDDVLSLMRRLITALIAWLTLAALPAAAQAGGAPRVARGPGGQLVPVAHIAGGYIPNDPGTAHIPGGWQALQWNLGPTAGVDAPGAWANLRADRRPGGKGVIVAVLDTGVAYRNWRNFRQSPDLRGTRFIDPCDLVAGKLTKSGRCTDPYPLDREGHGTWVASAVAESTNNRIGLTGLAYGATIMPVRVLNSDGWGYPQTIAAGIRYAVARHAQIINLSLEFYLGVTAHQIPGLTSAIRYAYAHGVMVVGAAGNDDSGQIAWPAADSQVVSVGATTADRCLADYSNTSARLDLVAPGGGDDADLPDPQCRPTVNLPDVYQMTFNDSNHPDRFSLPGGWYGTSMACPLVSATAALVIASRVIGAHPSPAALLRRLEQTATPLGTAVPNADYGWGLLNAAAATA
jgi:serine protease